MRLSRRQFIAGSTLLAASGATLWASRHWPEAVPEGVLLSGFEDLPGNQYVGGVVLPEGRVFGSRVTARVHGNAADPTNARRVIFFARRPGTEAFEFNLSSLEVTTAFATPAGRHLAGHGLFSPDGTLLLTPEHDYETPRGVIGIRDARNFRIVGEIATQGLDPHEIAWLPDGKTLIVANGGILTHPRTFRKKLNIPTMDPSLCLIDAASGRCLEQLRLPDHLLSIRHLAVTRDGSVAVGLQYEGDALAAPSVAALYRPGEGLKLAACAGHRPLASARLRCEHCRERSDGLDRGCLSLWQRHRAVASRHRGIQRLRRGGRSLRRCRCLRRNARGLTARRHRIRHRGESLAAAAQAGTHHAAAMG